MGDPPRIFFRDPSYDGQLARSLTATYAQSADLGEAMATARQIGRPTPSRWYDGWSARASLTRAIGDAARAAGDLVTARNAHLRASEYYRQAYYFVRRDLADPRLLAAHAGHVETFVAAIALMGDRAAQVRIPYDATALKGYFFARAEAPTPRPTLLLPCGYDSTAESGWLMVPSALERGYNVLSFEGPGQGEALITQKLVLRADYEHVLTQVIDWIVQRPEVDAERLVLIGRSFAGYLAPRAATVEHRIAALVCDPAQPDMGRRVPKGLLRRVALPVLRLRTRTNENSAEFFGARMAAHGLTDIGEYFDELERFTMIERAAQIRCPTLLIESEDDFAGGQSTDLQAALRCPVELIRLGNEQGAGGHCGGLGQRVWEEAVYGWLRRRTLNVER